MEIGTLVKVIIPYRLGEKRNGIRHKEGKVIGIYPNFILVEFSKGIRECYKEKDLILME